MKRLILLATIWVTTFTVTATGTAPAVLAATASKTPAANSPKQGQALEIAPPVITLAANPGQSVKTTIYLRNISSGDLIVTGTTNDFVAAGEDGTPKVLLKDEGNNPYSLKSWVSALPSLRLVPKEIKTMPVTITVPASAAPGGHYGVIRFTGTPANLQTTGVSLSASLGALVLLTVNGQTKEDLSVQEFYASHNGTKGTLFETGPVQFTERLKNNGNVHEQPVGQVTITNMFGKKIAAVNVNLPPRNILPASIRKFDEPLDKSVIGNKKLFGRYTANLSVTYGSGSKKTATASLVFWVVPYRLIAILAIVLVAGFFVLRNFIKRYNRRIIEKARQNPPKQPPAARM